MKASADIKTKIAYILETYEKQEYNDCGKVSLHYTTKEDVENGNNIWKEKTQTKKCSTYDNYRYFAVRGIFIDGGIFL